MTVCQDGDRQREQTHGSRFISAVRGLSHTHLHSSGCLIYRLNCLTSNNLVTKKWSNNKMNLSESKSNNSKRSLASTSSYYLLALATLQQNINSWVISQILKLSSSEVSPQRVGTDPSFIGESCIELAQVGKTVCFKVVVTKKLFGDFFGNITLNRKVNLDCLVVGCSAQLTAEHFAC